MLEVRDLTFGYLEHADVLSDITLSVPKGARLGVVGENGSGKTTLARLMCGLLKPTGGAVAVDGLDTADRASIHEVRRRVGIVFQDPDDQIVEVTVEREIGFGLRNLGLEVDEVADRVGRALDLFGIQHLRKRSCNLLSAGEKQILTVASIFAMQPDYVILDESTSLLDSRSRRKLVEAVECFLGETGAGLVFISMRVEDIWICDRVVFLRDGRLDFEGDKGKLLAHLEGIGIPLHGMPLLVSKLKIAVPGLEAEIAGWDSLSAEAITGSLLKLGKSHEGGNPWR
jgi:energy-coupling factor transporter ATP-binding protein EcfA2